MQASQGATHICDPADACDSSYRCFLGPPASTPPTTPAGAKIASDLNFVPNNSAIHLKNGKSQIYGIIIPDLTNPFFTELVKIFEELLVENEQEMLVANSDFHPISAQRSVRRMLLRRVDGVAMLSSELESASVDSLIRNRIPVVTTDHYRIANGLSDIKVDFSSGFGLMIAHLKALGHRQVGFIGGTDGLVTSRVRRESFLDAIVKQGLSSREEWMQFGNFEIDGGSSAMEKILALTEIPTAIVTANDLTAIGALRTAHEKGLSIPNDISICGCDDIEMSDIVYPPLTTLRIPRQEYARMLFDALQSAAKDMNQPGHQYRLPVQLVVRQSTGPVPAPGHQRGGSATRKIR